MLKKENLKIHFIQHLENLFSPPNTGDWICSPYNYFIDFFSRYTCITHSVWSILWHEIEKDDIVIFGGGGLLDNSNQLNSVLNTLFEKSNNVIIWAAGTHKYREKNSYFSNPTAEIHINFDKAVLGVIRDFDHPYNLPFTPCVSCLHPAFGVDKSKVKVERSIGVITSALENSFAISEIQSSISNAFPIGEIVNYILSSKVILTSTYHGAYWSQLLGRKVILPESRLFIDKYRYFKYAVGIYRDTAFDPVKLQSIASKIPDNFHFLDEARSLNMEFFSQVKSFIEERISPVAEPQSLINLSKRTAQLEFTLIEAHNTIISLESRIAKIEANFNKDP